MNYYKRHLGDYAKDTRHLSLAEHGAYCLLLDYYYSTERPIPDDRCERIANAYTDDERKAVRNVLEAFFTLTDEGWRNARADSEIAEFHSKSLKAKEAANARWSVRNADAYANASDTHSERNASHKPLANSHKEAKEAKASLSPTGDAPPADGVPACPHEAIVALYHEILPANPRIRVWDGARASQLRARWREDPKRQSLDYWRRFFEYIAQSPFLTGRTEGKNGRPFLPGLDWMVKAGNFAKIIEGRYHEQEAV